MMLVLLLGVSVSLQEDPNALTWNKDVAPIVSRRCASCHHAGGVAPFALLEHADFSRRGSFILKVIDAGLMPPWLPSTEGQGIAGSRGLLDSERAVLEQWVSIGAPLGNGEAVVAGIPGKRPMQVDLVRTMHQEMPLPEETPPAYHTGEMDQHSFRIVMANPEALRVQSIRALSNAPQAVRVMTFLADDGDGMRGLDWEDPLPGWRMGSDVGYIPAGSHGAVLVGGGELRLPSGYHWLYPRTSEIALGVHYRPNGRSEVLKETLEFELVPEDGASRPLCWLPVISISADVPAGEVVDVESREIVIPVDVDLVAITPRALEVCTKLKLVAQFPDGTSVVLLAIPDWDHHSRETYVLEKPITLVAGTRLSGEWVLDNRASNPRNPDDPPIDILRRKRAGILGTLLHVAARSDSDQKELADFGEVFIRSSQRH